MKAYPLKSDGVLKRYDYLWRLSADRWAWEYLRRNPVFRFDAACCSTEDVSEREAPCAPIRLLRPRVPQTLAQRWGLLMMADPDQTGLEADVFWSRAAHPDQVEVYCGPRGEEERCSIWDRTVPYCRITHLTDRHGREFLLLRGNGCVVQVRCTGLSLLGMEQVRLELGMSRREIATVLYGKEAVESEWADDRGSMRDAVKYLVSKAEGLRDGGYLVELLGGGLGPYLTAA